MSNKVEVDNFIYLKPLHIPDKIIISHKIVSSLLNVSHEISGKDVTFELSSIQQELLQVMKKFATSESKFIIARLEYEKKEDRFLKLTSWNEDKLDHMYTQNILRFQDIRSKKIMEVIVNRDIHKIIAELEKNILVIDEAISSCYKRIELIINLWDEMNKELEINIKNFEQRGLKYISNKLRLRILPELQEIKQALKDGLVKDASSRKELREKFDQLVQTAIDDIFGDISDEQVNFYEMLPTHPTKKEILDILRDGNSLTNLIELIVTEKIDIVINKKINAMY